MYSLFKLFVKVVLRSDKARCTKFLKSDNGRYPPIAYKVSKIEDTATVGITKFTMTQEQFDPARDNAELMIGNYYESVVNPEILEVEEIPTFSDFEITYSGKPTVRAGGGYKKFVFKERIDGKLVDATSDVEWNVDFGEYQDKLEYCANGNIMKVKCTNDYSLIGQTFTIIAVNKHSSKSIVCEVIGL